MIPRGPSRSGLLVALTALVVCWGGGLMAECTPCSPPRSGGSGAGPTSDRGLVYVASLPREVFRPEEPISLALKFTNGPERPVTIWSSGFWPNHRVVVTDERGEEPPLTDVGKDRRDVFAPGGARDKNAPRVLGLGETDREGSGPDLALLYRLRPGRYCVQVTYHDLQAPTPLRVISNAVAFEIKE